MTIKITSNFDGGNIAVIDITGDTATLSIRKDNASDFYQWFYFRVEGAQGHRLTLNITNCAGSAYPAGWPGYRARQSEDGDDWRCADTAYANGVLTITHTPQSDVIWFAYFAPYSLARQEKLVATAAQQSGVTRRQLGLTPDGRSIDCLDIGTGPKQVWLYGRQHPGETMAAWWMEGAIEMLVMPRDAHDTTTADRLREKCTFHIVPNMNPDGSFRGHLRTNAVGVNLNREWNGPTAERSPEVLCVLAEMDRTGVAFAMDIHGDESIPANFFAGFEGIPNWTEAQGALFYRFRKGLTAATHDFQDTLGYPPSQPGKANLAMSTNQLANRFGCVAMTLEMPFKDHDPHPVPSHGWSPERSKGLARACLTTLAGMVDDL